MSLHATRLDDEGFRLVSELAGLRTLDLSGVEPMTSTPEEFGAFIRSESKRFAQVIRDAGIKGD